MWIAEGRSSPDHALEPTTATRRWLTNAALAWGVALLSVIGFVAALLMRTAPARSSPSTPPAALRLTVSLPDGARLAHSAFPALALSPDGSRLAYVAERQGVPRLYLRQMDTFETREVPDREGAVTPFFSPDGRWIGFAGGGKLDGKSMLLTVGTLGTNMERARIVLHSLETGKRRVLIEGGAYAQYVESGHIVYGVGGSLMGAPFDPASGTITGASVPIFHGVTQTYLGIAQFSVSRTGALVFAPGPIMTPKRTLSWVDRKGTEIPLPLPARAYWPPRLSPDGRRLALGIEGPSHDVWVSEVDRDALSRLTSGADTYWPVWTPDGSRIIFQSNRTGPWNIFWIPVDRSGPEEQLVRSDNALVALFTSPDGRDLVYGDIAPGGPLNVWRIPINDPRSPKRLELSSNAMGNPVLSPDGQWMAYVGSDSGRNEVYVRRFPEGGLIRQATRDGGVTPAWSRNGRELFYVANERVKAIDVTSSGSELAFGNAHDLFKVPFPLFGPGVPLEVTPDGRRFLFVKQVAAEPGPTQINFVQGWQVKQERRV